MNGSVVITALPFVPARWATVNPSRFSTGYRKRPATGQHLFAVTHPSDSCQATNESYPEILEILLEGPAGNQKKKKAAARCPVLSAFRDCEALINPTRPQVQRVIRRSVFCVFAQPVDSQVRDR
ncbi:hypothetical protein PCANC_20700 [Puccinia coronata f. sp. avenae]|uniref:Uncharacterized protein n=1 Tax=Puccinia coronata f. sp. avenae TaxID=200324 RepID=A0A2N5SRT3_9BASI|nr:hypothetical protein PCASD_18994 [Puccinia coronata f. sp. avenae]PLW32021.1 hypothetical protein PCANC_20700 [Puccinia coronata f. sp. avenae]PLW32693.1 hypothetical protein PCASD_16832 [Puccinia coronata f. sp. avenae]